MEINPNNYNLKEMIEEFGLPLVFVSSFSRVLHKIKAPNAIISKYESFKHGTITKYLSKKYKNDIIESNYFSIENQMRLVSNFIA